MIGSNPRKTPLALAAVVATAVAGNVMIPSPASAAPQEAVSCTVPASQDYCVTAPLGVTRAGVLHITTGNFPPRTINFVRVTDIYTNVVVYGNNNRLYVGERSEWVSGLTNYYYGRLDCAGCTGATLWIGNF